MRFFALIAVLACRGLLAQTVAGTVVDASSDLGIPDVAVYFGSDHGPEYKTTTDSGGRFRIEGVKPGEYGAGFEKAGYIPQHSGTANSLLRPVKIAGSEPTMVQVRLSAFGRLRSRVVDAEGKPVAKALVMLGIDGEYSDDDGQVEFTDIRPGDYTIDAEPPPTPQPTRNSGERVEPIRTWYPSAPEKAQAQTIHIGSGANLTGYEIRMRTSPVYRVRGLVIGPDGKPAAKAGVKYSSPNDRTLSFSSSGFTSKQGPDGKYGFADAGPLAYFTVSRNSSRAQLAEEPNTTNGVFEFRAVPRGIHNLTAYIDTGNAMRSPAVSAISLFVDHDIDGLEIHIDPPATLQGSIEIQGIDKPYDRVLLSRAFISVDGLTSGNFRPDGSLNLASVSSGSHAISMAPGLPGGYYLASLTLGSRDIMGQPVNLSAGAPPLRVVYKPNGGTVAGSLDAEATAVVMIPVTSGGEFGAQGRTSTVASGSFAIESLAPGSYYAFAVDRVDLAGFYSSRFSDEIRKLATAVNVTEGSSISPTLKTIHVE